MTLAGHPDFDVVFKEFLNRLFLWIRPANAFPRMSTRRFLSAFIVGNEELVATTRAYVRLQDAGMLLASTTETILKGIQDGSIEGFSGINPTLCRLFWSNHELYRVAFLDYQKIKEKNTCIMRLLAEANLMAGIDPTIQPDDEHIVRIMAITGDLVNTTITIPMEEMMLDVCRPLAAFTRRALIAFEAEALSIHESDHEAAADLDLVNTMLRAKLILLDERIAAPASMRA